MGRSVTCNFAVNINFTDGSKVLSTQTCYGAMSFKEVKGIIASENNYQKEKNSGISVASAEVWPQTAKGRNSTKLDYILMTPDGKIEHKNIT